MEQEKPQILYTRRVSKTRAGGRRGSLQVYYLKKQEEGKFLVSNYKSPTLISINECIKNALGHNMVKLKNETFNHDMEVKFKGIRLIVKRSIKGGLVVSNIIKPIIQAAGIKHASIKAYGSKNPINMIQAVLKLLQIQNSYEIN